MARYFKYKTAEELREDARQLGGELLLSENYSSLFQSIQIGRLHVGSRLAVQPMEGCDGTNDGRPDELTYRRYERFGAGGAKFIWGEATAIAGEARMNPRQLWIKDDTAADLETMLQKCRQSHREQMGDDGDMVVGLQLTHSGRYCFQKPRIAVHDAILDSRTVDKSTGKTLDDSYPLLSDDDLKRIEDQYLVAARLAWKIGCDFVDLKQCHRYLLSELLAATTRPGDYGGSLENRTRLIRNIVSRIRTELPELVIVSRMNAYDGIPHAAGPGLPGQPVPHELPLRTSFGVNPLDHAQEDLTEPIQAARWLWKWGVSLLNISAGNPYANPHVLRPADYPPIDGYLPPEHPLLGVLRHFRLASAIQQAVPELPVMGSGYSWLQEYCMQAAAGNVAGGQVQMVGLGRGTLSHPDFAHALQTTGQLNRKQVCRTFSYCTNLMRTKDHPLGQYPTGCPPFDKEPYNAIWKEAQEKIAARKAAE